MTRTMGQTMKILVCSSVQQLIVSAAQYYAHIESIPGMHEKDDKMASLDAARQRDPDALPPSNGLQLLGTWLFAAIASCSRGNVLFAIKAAVLSGAYHSISVKLSILRWISDAWVV